MFLLYVLGVVAVALFNSQFHVQAQDPAFVCFAHGDPHVQLWRAKSGGQVVNRDCYTNGDHVLVKNKYVDFRVTVRSKLMIAVDVKFFDEHGHLIFQFQLQDFSKGPGNQKNQPHGVVLTTTVIGALTSFDMNYAHAQFVTSIRENGNCPSGNCHYNIYVWQPQSLVQQSTGICGAADLRCGIRALGADGLEEPAARSIPHELAESVCKQYMDAFYVQTRQAPYQRDATLDDTVATVLNGCIADLVLTGDIEMAQSSLDVLMMHELTRDATTTDAIFLAVESGAQRAASTVNAAVKMANVGLRRKRQLTNI